jgi:hypothetical protein
MLQRPVKSWRVIEGLVFPLCPRRLILIYVNDFSGGGKIGPCKLRAEEELMSPVRNTKKKVARDLSSSHPLRCYEARLDVSRLERLHWIPMLLETTILPLEDIGST